MKKSLSFFSLLSLFSLGVFAQKEYPAFERHLFIQGSDTLPYRLLKPQHYKKNKKYPLVIFYHGAGERGTDNNITLTHAAGLFLDSLNRLNYPCFVLVPQCPKGKRWVEVDWGADQHTQPAEISKPLKISLDVCDKLQKEFSIDVKRQYVTGLSMGGYAVWDVITRFPDRFAAAIPICGGGDEKTAEKIKNMTLWVFHGAKDKVVKPERSRNMIQAIENLGGKPKYTEYPEVQHNSWKNAYLEPDFLKWLFEQSK
jgi:predicted peptidase